MYKIEIQKQTVPDCVTDEFLSAISCDICGRTPDVGEQVNCVMLLDGDKYTCIGYLCEEHLGDSVVVIQLYIDELAWQAKKMAIKAENLKYWLNMEYLAKETDKL